MRMTIEEIHELDIKHHRKHLIGAEIEKCNLHDSFSIDGYKAGEVWVNGEWHYFIGIKVAGYEEVQRELNGETNE